MDGGRMSADLTKRVIYYNFYKQDVEQELCDSFWFYESSSSGADSSHALQPIACRKVCNSIEALYQSAVQAIASLDNQDEDGEGRKNLPTSLLQTEIPLTPETSSNNTTRTTAAIQYVAFLSYDPNSRVSSLLFPCARHLTNLYYPRTAVGIVKKIFNTFFSCLFGFFFF
jgi:hypothetical protein